MPNPTHGLQFLQVVLHPVWRQGQSFRKLPAGQVGLALEQQTNSFLGG